ncbi:hypothetical protein [Chitinimonas naiadis]
MPLSSAQDIRFHETPIEWARANPLFFFDQGHVSLAVILSAVIEGIQEFGDIEIAHEMLGDWYVVAATEDWFSRGQIPIPGDLRFDYMPAFPEWGANNVRPEFLIAAYARDVVVHNATRTIITQGEVEHLDPLMQRLAVMPTWKRVIAFRGTFSSKNNTFD